MTTEIIIENDLVLLRLPADCGYSDTWWRVVFIDLDKTFIGVLEKKHHFEQPWLKIGCHKKHFVHQVQGIYKEGEEFCYADGITICNCPGLCRNK